MKPPELWNAAKKKIASAESRYDIGIAVCIGGKSIEAIFAKFANKEKYPNPGAWTIRPLLDLGFERTLLVEMLAFCKEEAKNSKPSPYRVAARMLGYTEWSKAKELSIVVRKIRDFRKCGMLSQADLCLASLNDSGISAAREVLNSVVVHPEKFRNSPVEILAGVQESLRSLVANCPPAAEYPLSQAISWINATKEIMWNLKNGQ
jgi:hypothetical protein